MQFILYCICSPFCLHQKRYWSFAMHPLLCFLWKGKLPAGKKTWAGIGSCSLYGLGQRGKPIQSFPVGWCICACAGMRVCACMRVCVHACAWVYEALPKLRGSVCPKTRSYSCVRFWLCYLAILPMMVSFQANYLRVWWLCKGQME